jgi:hypothetical protein
MKFFVHQETYFATVLKRFYMDKSHQFSTSMIVRSLNVKKDNFIPREEDEEIIGLELPFLSAIGALIYLANYTRLDILFSVNLFS